MENTVPSDIPSSVVSINGVSADTQETEETKRLQAKNARAFRKLEMEKKAAKKTNPSSITSSTFSSQSSSGGSSPKSKKKRSSERNEDHNVTNYTPNDMKLRLVLHKTLSCTDVSELGRIVLPKRGVEQNLPVIASKKGVDIVMKEVSSNEEWRMILRYWGNHKGNIYVFDQCGDFIKKYLMEAGDQLNVYKDDQRNLYFSIMKKEKGRGQSNMQENVGNNYNSMTSEEESTLRILMEELKDKEEEEPNTLTTLYNSGGGSLADGN